MGLAGRFQGWAKFGLTAFVTRNAGLDWHPKVPGLDYGPDGHEKL